MRTLMVCGVLLALAMPARATVIVPADLGELSRDARTIVRGRVASLDAQWTADRGTIETIVTLEVESYLKGSLGPTLSFRVPGGDLGRFRSIVVGAPEFAVDEHVIVFLGARDRRGPPRRFPRWTAASRAASPGTRRSRRPRDRAPG